MTGANQGKGGGRLETAALARYPDRFDGRSASGIAYLGLPCHAERMVRRGRATPRQPRPCFGRHT